MSSPPPEGSVVGCLSRVEHLMEKMLQRMLLSWESCQSRSRGPAAAPGARLHYVSPSEDVSVDYQSWADSHCTEMRGERSIWDPREAEVPTMVCKFAMPSLVGELLDELAANINYFASHQLQEQVMMEAAMRYHAPRNHSSLKVPAVNSSIWSYIGGGIKIQEVKPQHILNLLVSGLTAFARSVDGSMLSESQRDAMALLCNAFFEINCFRKNAIRPVLNPTFAGLCKSSNVQPPNLLFGEDLSRQVFILWSAEG
ncbi:uncharacterized protein LOC129702081 [Leucoraja erinacea]|uniref:uncharacterized protein LOC129702081 n=1 Tax=Leucoraja erinaceus TaxID=7782 RepID=UPI002454DB86|nr:uncharacterized protein LOC129702081 [Leucoraja erinacea]